ncbi:MAG: hypothetical protein IJR14_00540 [Synergistaceae bacterium]|nr:hypothetical protein [Synergistaceae bacterium]
MPELEYITKDAFDIQVRSLRERDDSDEKVSEARFDRLEALMARNLAEQKELVKDIRAEVLMLGERMDRLEKDVGRLNEKFDDLREDMGEVRGDVKALSSRVDALQTKFGWYLTLFGVAIAAVLAIAQRMWG